MTIQPIPFEQGRFYVQSRTRHEITHIVDLQWQEEPWSKPHGMCSCEACQAQGLPVCAHLVAVTALEMARLHL